MTAAALSTVPSARVARLGFALAHPTFTTDQAKALHITHAVGVFTSDMGVSSANRIFNVHLMARILDGKIIHPGATFSFNQVVGPRTAQRGFLEGQAIENGQLVPSIGGGVCQVATTVFNAAFLAGLPIVSRTNHSFYISHYPLGLDATVADGGPDLVFRNDTGKPILIRTWYTDQTLTVGFYSSPTGRTVHYQTSSQTGQTQPVTEYKYDATLPPGAMSQQTSGEAGFDVSVTRTVLDGHGHTPADGHLPVPLRAGEPDLHGWPRRRGPEGRDGSGRAAPAGTEEEDQAVEPAVVDHDDADDHLQGHELGHGHDAADADAGDLRGARALTS